MRQANRRDLLHSAVGNIFRQQGWSALDTSRVGDGAPDWLIAKGAVAFLVEVKSPQKIRRTQTGSGLNEKQREFQELWRGLIFTVESLEEVWKVLDKVKSPIGCPNCLTGQEPAVSRPPAS